MDVRGAFVIAFAAGCAERRDPAADGATPTDTAAPEGTEPVCTVDASFVEMHMLMVFEDFDFLADGTIVTGANGFLMAYAGWGARPETVGAGLGDNPTGVRGLPSGDVAVADVSNGQVVRVDPDTGGFEAMAAGLSNPNGLAVGPSGELFVSEHIDGGRVLRRDPDGTIEVVLAGADGDAPNGLSLDGRGGLYVAYQRRVERVALDSGERETVYEGTAELDAVTVDACGAVYTIGYAFGELIRIDPDGSAEELLRLEEHGTAFSSLRWGTGADGLPRDHLYAGSQHNGVAEVAIGATGAPPVF